MNSDEGKICEWKSQVEECKASGLTVKEWCEKSRKNWLFSNTAKGAKASGSLYSIISTAQANNLDVEKYLTELFSKPAGTIFMPWEVKEN